MGRRSKGEGSIIERPDGSFAHVFDLGKDPVSGRRQRRWVTAKTKSELQRKVADLRAIGGGTVRPRATGSVAEWFKRWLEDDVRPNRSANTYALYEAMWRVHVEPRIAHLQLEKIDPETIARLYADLRRSGSSSAVVQSVSTVLHRAFEVAVRRRIYHRANPVSLVEKPRHRAKEARALNADEARRFLEAARGDRYEALWILLLTAGVRLGEVLGLQWGDVDFARQTLSIRRSLSEVNGVVEVSVPKTASSRRLIELGAMTIDALRALHAAHGNPRSTSPIFCTSSGSYLRRSNLRRSHFVPILRAAGLGHLRIHDLRHSMTSLALYSGVSPKVVAERLGQSTTRLTQDRYQHVLPGLQREAAERLDDVLRGT